MSLFDDADRQTSAAMDRFFADPVVWRPMAYRAGGRYTSSGMAGGSADPERPVRGEDQTADPFVAVVVWKPTTIDPGTKANEQGGLPAGDVMLEFSVELFRKDGVVELPLKGDIFEIASESGHTTRVYLPREPVDDGSTRIQCFCNGTE